jgi:hypothetical protein
VPAYCGLGSIFNICSYVMVGASEKKDRIFRVAEILMPSSLAMWPMRVGNAGNESGS